MQKALTGQQLSENDFFTGHAASDAKESDEFPVSLSTRKERRTTALRFPDNVDLLGGSEEKKLQQLTEKLDKTAADYGWKSAPTKAKLSPTASIRDHQST